MIKKTAKIVNKLGLHARPSAMLVTAASKYNSEVFFTKNGLRVNGKSILGVMMLAAEMGSELLIEVDGPDEEQALREILQVIESRFGEGE
ncbi:HPr family phosphocarrier protein [candidate division GN15 bacterium]|uniref:HPr family phosphocarrier protein n=1 Tax=candidate division GN15 bacterium TaxID=2072418 RepID=A0A855X4I3_9BACT|nr:MAG: HPr family phosphocarrier protein [candidate division GN15 bacterium]